MNIQQTIEELTAIRDGIKEAIKAGDHVLEAAQKRGERVTVVDVPTGHLSNAAGAVQRAIENLEGFLEKIAEVEATNKKLQVNP